MVPRISCTVSLLACCIISRCAARNNIMGGPPLVQPTTHLDPSTSSIYMDCNAQHRNIPAIKSSGLGTTKDMFKTVAWNAMPLLAVVLSRIPAVSHFLSIMLGADAIAPNKIVKHIVIRTSTALRMRPAATMDDVGLPPATVLHPFSNDPACKQPRHPWLVGSTAVMAFLVGLAGHAWSRESRLRAMAARAANVTERNAKQQLAPSPIQSAFALAGLRQTSDLQLGQASSKTNKQVEFHRMMTVEGPSRQATAAEGDADMENEMNLTADFYRISTEQPPPSPRILIGA
eukprot:TRINITY_DN32010_c0_g1_i1.p1 TRINITY_DN32010_c0_g1~~TRINITY_DN32010_c0_g1_i1.p1  ORF type:complete len:288 (-),score=33.27 TRINITY_DN32010_c0_g1_i1:382-1245(-)